MTVLLELQSAHAFDPAPRRFDLGIYHVPFDELLGHRGVESELARAVRVPERVGLVGGSGSGKTSLTSYVLGPLEEDIAPIRIPVATESTDTIVAPDQFARHVVRTVSQFAVEASLLTESDRQRAAEKATAEETLGGRSKGGKLAINAGWLAGKPELSAELQSATQPTQSSRSGSEIVEQATRVVDLIGSAGLIPVLVIDDSDSWLTIPGGPNPDELVTGFFGPVARMLAEEMNAAIIFSIHESYLGMDGYKRAEGFIETRIHLPHVPDPEGLARILEKRVKEHSNAEISEVFSRDGLLRVFEYYEGPATYNLRKSLVVCHTALQTACTDGAETITSGHINTALAELAP